MTVESLPLYSPALRMKAGELEGVRLLANDVADCVMPRFIIPPSAERDQDVATLPGMERVPDISNSLAISWRARRALVDATFILDEFGRDRASDWLPPLFLRARERGVRAIPAAFVGDIADCSTAYRAAIDASENLRFAMLVSSDDLIGPDVRDTVETSLTLLGIRAENCAIIADFTDVEFSNSAVVAPIIRSTLETLQEYGLWNSIIFQGSHFPDKNPADHDSTQYWSRNEWLAWKHAVRFDPSTADQMIFGDYAADCSRIEFGGSGGKAIRHLRYTVGDKWRIERGPKAGPDRLAMHRVYSRIAESSDFAGAGFSKADAFIAEAAAHLSASHGNAKVWRALNTTHHISQVVRDVANVKGVKIVNPAVGKEVQMDLQI